MSDLESQLTDSEKELYESHKRMNSELITKLDELGVALGDHHDVEYYYTSDSLENISELHHHLKEKYQYETSASKTKDGNSSCKALEVT